MSLMTPHTAPNGRQMMVDSAVLDIDARIKRGDPTCGWSGDEGMGLAFDPGLDLFIVTRYDPATGRTQDIMSWPPPLDARLLKKLAAGDTQARGNDPIADYVAKEEKRERDAEQAMNERIDEDTAPRLVHAMRKGGLDVGQIAVAFPETS